MMMQDMPMNVDAEAAVLGSVLIDPEALGRVRAIIEPDQFYTLKHRWIYEAFIALEQRGEPIDYMTVLNELGHGKRLESVGGAVYIARLLDAVPSAINAESYARIILKSHQQRQVITMAEEMAKLGYSGQLSEAGDYLRARLDELLQRQAPVNREYQPFQELAAELPDIDFLWNQWLPLGMLSLMGAVPGAGKSMVALDLCRRVMYGKLYPAEEE